MELALEFKGEAPVGVNAAHYGRRFIDSSPRLFINQEEVARLDIMRLCKQDNSTQKFRA
jgi:hypothetical protein